MKLAIITARGGSKRIPKKNIKEFLGKPIISYPITYAIKSNLFDEIMVSTDDAEIADIAKSYGASVPFFRSKKTSDDFSTTTDVLIEVLSEYKKRNIQPEYFCCIYPTAIFATPNLLNQAFHEMIENNYDSILPIVKFGFPIWRSLRLKGKLIEPIWPENMPKRSQDLEPTYHDSGQFYWYNNKFPNCVNTGAIILSEFFAQDIDTIEDWRFAEIKYKIMLELGLIG